MRQKLRLKYGVGLLTMWMKTYIEATNAEPRPFRWAKTADDILASIQRFCLRTLDAIA
jgi:hypothetical protein